MADQQDSSQQNQQLGQATDQAADQTSGEVPGTEKVTDQPRPKPESVWECEKDLAVDNLPPQGKVEKVAGAENVPLETMTVGRKFLLRCQGEPAFFNRDKIKLDVTKNFENALVLLEVRRIDEKSADFLMTSYKPGEHVVKEAIITDGKVHIGLSELPLHVHSVIEPPKDGKPPQPFGPFGPIELSWPWYYWAIIAAILLLVVGSISRVVFKKLRWKRLMEELDEYSTAMQPYNQFNKDIRMIHREFETPFEGEEVGSTPDHLKAVERAFRLYLVRELRVPALTWGNSDIMRVIRRRQKGVYNNCGQFLRVTFREFDKAHAAGDRLKPIDCQQLAKLCQQTITRVWKAKKAEAHQ